MALALSHLPGNPQDLAPVANFHSPVAPEVFLK